MGIGVYLFVTTYTSIPRLSSIAPLTAFLSGYAVMPLVLWATEHCYDTAGGAAVDAAAYDYTWLWNSYCQ